MLPRHHLSYFRLTEMVRQSDAFSALLTKIGDSPEINAEELTVLCSRFVMREEAAIKCPASLR